MVKKKSRVVVKVPDGSGGMVQVEDKRFEQGDWPIYLTVPAERADTWFIYLSAECHRRKWSTCGVTQQEGRQNSGSKTIASNDSDSIDIVWERKRDRDLALKARPSSKDVKFREEVSDFFEQVEESSKAEKTEVYFRAWQIGYDGLPWKGELWLDQRLRLSPPSLQYDGALSGPRIVLVQGLIDAIYPMHAQEKFQSLLQELSIFLSVTLGMHFHKSKDQGKKWTWERTPKGEVRSDVRDMGYWELNSPTTMAAKGEFPPVPLRSVVRPELLSNRIMSESNEMSLPEDICDLWRDFRNLNEGARRQFLEVGKLWQLALSLGNEHETTRFALMVVACEGLKPREHEYRNTNIYNVVDALLGESISQHLKDKIRPQVIRNTHLHEGRLSGSEMSYRLLLSDFVDPTFRESSRELHFAVKAAIVAWLQQGGISTMAPIKRRKTWRRQMRDQALWLIPAIFVLGLLVGAWLIWTILHRLTTYDCQYIDRYN